MACDIEITYKNEKITANSTCLNPVSLYSQRRSDAIKERIK